MSEDVVTAVVTMAADVFGRPARPGDNIYDLGGDSLLAVVFALRLEEAFGVDVETEAVTGGATLEAIAARLGPPART